MMRRVMVIALAILVSLPLVIKSRMRGTNPAPAAFSAISSGAGLIRISGDVLHPGLYPMCANLLTGTAIKLAVPVHPVKSLVPAGSGLRQLSEGDHMKLVLKQDGTGIITVEPLSTHERMILGIPLDINDMSVTDFELLPGVGVVVAKRIVAYRQKNGGLMKVYDLLAIEGIGEKKYGTLLKYF